MPRWLSPVLLIQCGRQVSFCELDGSANLLSFVKSLYHLNAVILLDEPGLNIVLPPQLFGKRRCDLPVNAGRCIEMLSAVPALGRSQKGLNFVSATGALAMATQAMALRSNDTVLQRQRGVVTHSGLCPPYPPPLSPQTSSIFLICG